VKTNKSLNIPMAIYMGHGNEKITWKIQNKLHVIKVVITVIKELKFS
jgi:hypothetical protein